MGSYSPHILRRLNIMSRIDRRKWTMNDFGHRNSKGIFGLLDVAMKENLRITDDEYDDFAQNSTDEELDLISNEHPKTFAEKREIIKILHKYAKY